MHGDIMKFLQRSSYLAARQFIDNNARPFDVKLAEMHFDEGSPCAVLRELQKFQNDDGGFGGGIELDFTLPHSSPMATSVGLRHLASVDKEEQAQLMVRRAVSYLERTFVPERNGWYAVPPTVNDHPHAPWWHYDEEEGQTVIDRSWGNPTAELIGYLYRYWDMVTTLHVEHLLHDAIDYFTEKEEYRSEHEVYCFIRLYHLIPESVATNLEGPITRAATQLVNTDREAWELHYVPTPLKFVHDPDGPHFGIADDLVDENLDFLVDTLERYGKVEPTWSWGQYEEHWKRAKTLWTGVLTLEALLALDRFDRL